MNRNIVLITADQQRFDALGCFGGTLARTPVVDRPRPELEPLVGLFLNTVVLRTDLSGRPSFRELVRRVRDVSLQAFANQELPFEQVVDEVRPNRDAGRNPLFEVLFTLQNAPHEHVRFGQLASRREETAADQAKFDVTLFLCEHDDGLAGTLEYRADLFEASTIERLAAMRTAAADFRLMWDDAYAVHHLTAERLLSFAGGEATFRAVI